MREVEVKIPPEEITNTELIGQAAAKAAKIPYNEIQDFRVIRRSLDARYRPPLYVLRVMISTDAPIPPVEKFLKDLPQVQNASEVHIVGAGPAGYFAALECIRLGLKPIVLDRGKDVRSRRKDLRAIQQEGIVNPHSNYCFGEGGAGTYSDGKLYTRSSKRGDIQKILGILVESGADPEILVEAHPHIGSNKLPGIIASIRETIESHGGQIIFNAWVNDLILEAGNKRIKAIKYNDNERMRVNALILATGHSARDIFLLLREKEIFIEPKPFALGVRVEHSQAFIDECQYGLAERGDALPAASYSLSAQINEKGVFSFCMCPGGLIVPAATAPGEIVVNGMSLSRRDSPFANSGIVTSVEMKDLTHFRDHGPLMGMEFQKTVERRMFQAGDGSQAAPAQRVTDFLMKNLSGDLPGSSYIPGLISAPLHELLPVWIYERLRAGIVRFDQKLKGFIQPNAVVVATESRTSSPVRIPRSPSSGMHIEVEGLFPCGEGAGYAGGIVSAAMDGQYSANAVAKWIKQNNL